jgi:large subunit ribosomal protein L7/L12
MTTMDIRKCGGCGAPLPPGSNVCEFCGSENVDESVTESGTAFDVILVRVGTKPINVIKVIREITNLGLRESKALTENPPSVVKNRLNKSEAEGIKKRLEEVGAFVEIRNSTTGTTV